MMSQVGGAFYTAGSAVFLAIQSQALGNAIAARSQDPTNELKDAPWWESQYFKSAVGNAQTVSTSATHNV